MTTTDIDRRTAIKASAATVAVGGFGALTLLSSNTAAASSFSLAASDVSTDSADGSISEVYLEPAVDLWWEDFTDRVTGYSVLIESRIDGETDWQDAYQTDESLSGSDTGHSGSVEETLVDGNDRVTLYDGADTAYFEPDADGASETTAVVLRGTVVLLSDGETADPEARAVMEDETAFEVEVGNRPADAGGEIDAGTGVE